VAVFFVLVLICKFEIGMDNKSNFSLNKIIDRVCWLAIIFLLFYSLVEYFLLPSNIPIHFDENGKVNDMGSSAAVFLFPGIALISLAPLMIFSRDLKDPLRILFFGIKLTLSYLVIAFTFLFVNAVKNNLLVVPPWFFLIAGAIFGVFLFAAGADFVKREFEKAK
jgi:hypothetical protein